MDIELALKKEGGVAPMFELRKYGIDRAQVWAAIREQRITRIRNGWVGLRTLSPYEFEAIFRRGLLTCTAAASIRGLPCETVHLHVRSKLRQKEVAKTVRRNRPLRTGAMVGLVDMIEDYIECQPAEWSLALVDALTRNRKLKESEWVDLAGRVNAERAGIIRARSSLPESPLESLVRYRLMSARVPHSMQVPIGKYRVDFVVGRGVVIEAHGAEFHAGAVDWERDRRKVAWLRSQGWDVLEFTFTQIVNEWPAVFDAIKRAISARPRGFVPKA